MSWEISWALCRTCMDADSELFPLYDEGTAKDLSNKLAELTEIQISKVDGLPSKLCEKCILKIKAFSKFKKLVQESDRKLKRMFITAFPYNTQSNEVTDEMKWKTKGKVENVIENQVEDGKENHTEKQMEDEIEIQMVKQLEDNTKIQMEKQLEDDTENQLKKQLDDEENKMKKELVDETEIKMKIEYAESDIGELESCIFDKGDENSSDKIEVNCDQLLNVTEKEAEEVTGNSCYIDSVNSGQNIHDVLKSNMWTVVYSDDKTENIDEESNSAQSVPFVLNEEVNDQESVSKSEIKRKSTNKKKKKKKKIEENTEIFTADTKESNNNSDTSDFDSYTENMDNIVGSLNDTITKVKEIRENGKDTYYQCTLCLQNYTVLTEALSHIVDLHVPVNGPFYCVVCEMDCDSMKHLKNHVKIHKGANPYICFICNKAYVMKRYLKRHMVCHTDFHRHRCAKCGERFKVRTDLETHIKSHNAEAAYSCNQCSRVFNHKGNYKRHLISHLDPNGVHIPKFPCVICNKRFVTNRTLQNHMRVHTGEKPFKCNVCEKSFSQQGNLLNHAKVHTNPRSFGCQVCGKKFNQKSTLKDHTRIHTGEKYYVCSICGASFTFSAALGRHMWTHSDKKPFECDICDASFTGSYDLKRHIKSHNGNSKRKCKPKKKEEEVVEFFENVSAMVQETSTDNTIVIEQIFLCENSIQIISQEESGKENADSLLCLI